MQHDDAALMGEIQPFLSDEQQRQVIDIAVSVQSLTQHPGWLHFERAVEALIKQESPRPDEIKDPNHALQLASKTVYTAGMRAVLEIPRQQVEALAAIREYQAEMAKLQNEKVESNTDF